MKSRNSLIILVFFLFGLGALGCSGGGDLGGLTPTVDEGDTLASAQSLNDCNTLATYDGTSIPLADVYVDGELTTFTDENGAFELQLTPGEHTVGFGYDDIIFHETTVDSTSRQVMHFPRPPKVGSVAGTVFGKQLNSEDGEYEPLENAIVIVCDMDTRWFDADVTGEDGKYHIKNAPAGASMVAVFARGYLPWTKPIFINPNTLQIRNVFMKRAPNLGLLLGLVRTPEFDPIGDVHIVLSDPDDPEFEKHALTKDCGVFLINKIPPGVYGLHARKEGFEPVDRPVVIERGRNFVRIKMFPVNDDGGGGE